MPSLRRTVALSALVPVAGAAMAALLACAPPSAADHQNGAPAPAHTAAAHTAAAAGKAAGACGSAAGAADGAAGAAQVKSNGPAADRSLHHFVRLAAKEIRIADHHKPGSGQAELTRIIEQVVARVKPLPGTDAPKADAGTVTTTTPAHRTDARPGTVAGHRAHADHATTATVGDCAEHHDRHATAHGVEARLAAAFEKARPLLAAPDAARQLHRAETAVVKAAHLDPGQAAALTASLAHTLVKG
ncbi:hypothetical protein [Streptomyces sp. NPDC059918]|uniref:hypothetical protein n=1 Tax=unclassified Streptomyces TaxID=2593676 RepID=UPI0036646BED